MIDEVIGSSWKIPHVFVEKRISSFPTRNLLCLRSVMGIKAALPWTGGAFFWSDGRHAGVSRPYNSNEGKLGCVRGGVVM